MLEVEQEGAVHFIFQYSGFIRGEIKEQVTVIKYKAKPRVMHIEQKGFSFNRKQKELTIFGCQETVIWTECQHPNPHFGISPISNRFDVLERDWYLGNVIWN